MWHSRRDRRVARAIAEIGVTDGAGIAYLAAEIQLYYKAKERRPRDESDFRAVLPVLTQRQRAWLADLIAKTYGGENPWLVALGETRM